MALAGGIVDGPGHYFAPVVLTDVSDDNVAAQEELFGPIAPILPFADEADAIRIANGSEFGLASAVWTRDEDRAARMEAAIEAGAVFINDMVRSGRPHLVRRHKVVRLWTRARTGRGARVHQRQDRVGGLMSTPYKLPKPVRVGFACNAETYARMATPEAVAALSALGARSHTICAMSLRRGKRRHRSMLPSRR